MYTKNSFLPLILVFTSMMPSLLLANTLTPQLLSPEGRDYRKPSERIVLQFPFDILGNVTTQLALEVDNIDVSSLVLIEGSQVIYAPSSPLSPGLHQLRLVEYAANGDIVELGDWRFEVRQSAAFQEQHTHVTASQNNSLIVADDYSPEDPDINRYHANGAVDINYSARNQNSAVHFQGNLIYQEDEEDSIRRRQLDLGPYLLRVDVNEYTQLNAGHHAVNYSSLIYRDFNRRGVSGNFSLPGINSKLQVFGSRTGDLHGFSEGLGVSDSEDRASGAVFNFQPISSNPGALTISAGYMTGAQKSDDASLGYFVEESSGDAQSIAFDSILVDQRVRLYLEAAQSDFDFDGDADGLSKIQDNAYQFVTQYTSKPGSNEANPWLWGVSFEKMIVEPSFYTLSNRNLISDSDFTRVSTSLSKGPWFSQLSFTTEQDNLDDRFDSTNRTDMMGADVTYSGIGSSKNPLLDSRTYRLVYQHTKQTQDGVELDELFQPLPENDIQTQFLELSSEYSYQWGSWYFLINHNSFEDNANVQEDSKSEGVEWGGDFVIKNQHRLATSISFYDTNENDSPLGNELVTYRLGIISHFKSMAMTSSVTIDFEQIDDSLTDLEPIESDKLTLGATLAKQLYQPKGISPGMDLQLRASYSDLDSQSTFDEDSNFYEIFMDLNFFWDSQSQDRISN